MRQLVILVILCVFLFCSCSERKEKVDCSRFISGKFEYQGSEGEKILIDRSDSIHIETDVSSGITMKFKVDWVETCVYELHFLSYIVNGRDSSVGSPANPAFPPVRSRIIEAARNYYISISAMKGEKISSRDTILKTE